MIVSHGTEKVFLLLIEIIGIADVVMMDKQRSSTIVPSYLNCSTTWFQTLSFLSFPKQTTDQLFK